MMLDTITDTEITPADRRRELRAIVREIAHYRADLAIITDPGQRQRVKGVVAELERRMESVREARQ